MDHPSKTMRQHAANQTHIYFNDKRKNCPGCKKVRSMAQFDQHPDYCRICVLRNKHKIPA